jgi:hypothetical protein
VTYEVPGALVSGDGAVEFAGTSDGPTVADNDALDQGDGPFSIDLWFRRATLGTNQVMLSKGAGAPLIQFQTSNRIAVFKNGTGGTLVRGPAVTDSGWHYLVFTKSASADMRLYLDAADVTTFDKNETFVSTAAQMRVAWSTATTRFVGGMDDLSLTAAVLTPQQILTRYQIALGTYIEQPQGYPWGEPEIERLLREEEDDEEALVAALSALDP